MRVIRVKGTGQVSATPNLIVIRFTVKGEDYNYDEAMRILNERTAYLRSDVVKAGFKADDLKTTQFNVQTQYKYQQNQNIFVGYQALHELKLEFDFDRQQLNQLLRVMSDSKSNAEFNIYFEVKDKEQFKNDLIEDAVKDAMQKAQVIANTANIKLGNIINISYDFTNVIYRSDVMVKSSMEMSDAAIDIIPDDIEASDYVTMEWQIE